MNTTAAETESQYLFCNEISTSLIGLFCQRLILIIGVRVNFYFGLRDFEPIYNLLSTNMLSLRDNPIDYLSKLMDIKKGFYYEFNGIGFKLARNRKTEARSRY